MPAKRTLPRKPQTAVGKLIYKWWKAQPIDLSLMELSRLFEVSHTTIHAILFSESIPTADTLIMIALQTKEFNTEHPADYNDPHYPWPGPGIPLLDLLEAKDPRLAEAIDQGAIIQRGIELAQDLDATERKKAGDAVERIRQRLRYNLPIVEASPQNAH